VRIVQIAYDLWRTPVQVWDAIEEIIAAQRSPSVAASFESEAVRTAVSVNTATRLTGTGHERDNYRTSA
jgi:hypothetical protein